MSELREMLMRHRIGLAEAALLIGLVIALGFLAMVFDLNGSISADQRVDLSELIVLGMLVTGGLAIFGWRRFREQEREIALRAAAEDHARFLAHHDHLTGLPNRRRFRQALDAAVAIPPSAERVHAVLLLDLNGFKAVNDIYGHGRGDEVLSTIARRLSGVLREGDMLARIGGDEFAIVAREISGVEGASNIAAHIGNALEQPITIAGDQHQVGTGIGIALIPRDGFDPSELLRKADVALYKTKADQELGYAFYQDEMDKEARLRSVLQRDLAAAIGTDALVPHYQPIVDLKSGKVKAFEALARWTHPTMGEIAPDRFIPIAEHSNLIRDLTYHLLALACAEAAKWPPEVMLSFNISPMLLRDRTLGVRILDIASKAGLTFSRLELEITENAIVRDLEGAQDTLGSLHSAGVRIALDDFGTGATSLFHLRSFKFDTIKIDRSFVQVMSQETESAAIVKAIVGLAKGLGVEIVAEGVEDQAQRAALREQGCKDGQGFLFSAAVPAAETHYFFKPDVNLTAAA